MNSLNHLKVLSEAYRNIAQAPTQTNVKGDILSDLEQMIQQEMLDIRYPKLTTESNLPDPITF